MYYNGWDMKFAPLIAEYKSFIREFVYQAGDYDEFRDFSAWFVM